MASRFWVGGTGTWDASDTTHWAASSGGAGGQSVPGTSDTATLDGSSGGGTVTVNATISIQSLTCGAFTGTLDFSANNNNVTLSSGSGFSGSGSGARTINLGNGTWTLSSTSAIWTIATITNLTFNANSSVIAFTGAAGSSNIVCTLGASLAYSTITVAAAGVGFFNLVSTSNTITTLTLAAGAVVSFVASTTTTIGTFAAAGSTLKQIFLRSTSTGTTGTVAVTTSSIAWCGIRDLTITGSSGAANSFNLGNVATIVVTPPTMTRSRAWSGF